MNTRIAGAASAFPKNYYSQDVIREALKHKWAGKLDNPLVLDRFHASVGVEGRHLALPIPAYHDLKTWGDANNAWIESAIELGKQALCRALNGAGIGASELGAIFFVSVTGIASPSIEGLAIPVTETKKIAPNSLAPIPAPLRARQRACLPSSMADSIQALLASPQVLRS